MHCLPRFRPLCCHSSPRRGLRRAVPVIPALPPPSVPLPAVPPVPDLSISPTSPLPTIAQSPRTPVTPRRPLTRRIQTCDNYHLSSAPFSVAGASPMCVMEDEDTYAASLRAGLPSSPALKSPGAGAENEMQVDYPSPVDGAVFEWGPRN